MYRSPRSLDVRSTLIGALGCTVLFVTLGADRLGTRQTSVSTISMLTREQAEILSHMSVVYLDDRQGGVVKTIRISECNLQVVNGSGATVNTEDGLGNVIIGYNQGAGALVDDRTGSHNLVLGDSNSYLRYGGIVSGTNNAIGGFGGCSVIGGDRNVCNSDRAVMIAGESNEMFATGGVGATIGGKFNRVYANRAVTVGGEWNTILQPAMQSAISGGRACVANGLRSAITAGDGSWADGEGAALIGGLNNRANGDFASVVGGNGNVAGADTSTVGGGRNRTAVGVDDWVAGSLFEDD